MNIVEALKLSNKVRRAAWILGSSMTFSEGIGQYDFSLESLLSDDWEPVLPEKKTVKKKFYRALVKNVHDQYTTSAYFYENEDSASEDIGNMFIRLLTEYPIEIEVTE